MSGIVLSASVRQNLLSLQSTASLLATTQNDLSTGNKVNSALDNPTNYFTAQALNNRASDINNLLDSIGNGVQVLQAANTGITSLQSLVSTAQSIANQALQTTVGYDSKSSFSTTISGATASNLLGTGAPTDATVNGANETNNQTTVYSATTGVGTAVTAAHQTAYTNTAGTLGSQLYSASSTNASGTTLLSGLTDSGGTPAAIANGDTLTVNGKVITFGTGAGALTGSGNAYTLGIGTSLNTLVAAIDTLSGNTGTASTDTGGQIQINTGNSAGVTLSGSGSVLANLGLSASGAHTVAAGGGITSSPVISASTNLSGGAVAGGADGLATSLTTSDSLIVNNKTITFHTGNGNTGSIAGNDLSIGLGNGTVQDILTAIGTATGGTATVDGTGHINLTTSTTTDISLAGSNSGTLTKLGLSAAATTTVTRTAAATPALTGSTLLSGASSGTSDSLTTAFAVGDTVTVNGQNLTFVASGASTPNQINIGDSVSQLLSKIDVLSGNTGVGSVASAVSGGHVVLHTGTSSNLTISSSNSAALAALGFSAPVSQACGVGTSPLNGLTLSIAATGGGTPTNLTFGTGLGQVQSLNDLNNALAPNNLQATLAANGTLTISTSNDSASATIGAVTGTAAGASQIFFGAVGSAPVGNAAAQSTRNNLITQYNNVLNQITTTAQDASFNGVNLLGGDTLKLTFNETGKSTLSITGVNFNAAGLGLSALNIGDFKDNNSVNSTVSGLAAASNTLRSEASQLGSNLSIVQIRQDFSKNLINVLQTGSSNLTLADTNEEAANSQALSTRQSIAVSALALANTSQQSVLQLLR